MSLAAAGMTEAELQDTVRRMCDRLGILVRHVRDERGNWVQGWPDLDIVGTRIIYRELKSQRGVLTPDQRRVGALITRAEGDWAVWRPADLASGVIARQLTVISKLASCVNATCDDYPHTLADEIREQEEAT